jgi:TonB family protein
MSNYTKTITCAILIVLCAVSALAQSNQNSNAGSQSEEVIYKPSDVTKSVEIISKPNAEYTSVARDNNVTGSVFLWVVFRSSGTVTNIRIKSGLPFGLSEKAIAAARKIKFKPAEKDGQPVSVLMTVEYEFTLPKN